MNYTVEVTTHPVVDDNWSTLRHVIDVVPGTLLIEDPEEPMLVIPVDAASPLKAAQFVDGLSTLIGFQPVTGNIYETPECDFDLDDDDEEPEATGRVVEAINDWVDSTPSIDSRLRDSHKIPCH